MWTDPIVEETRRIRDEHAREFNYDLAAIFADIKRFEASLPVALFALDEGEEKAAADKEDLLVLVPTLQRSPLYTSVPKPVIPAGMPESSHMDVNLWTGTEAESSTCASG